MGNSRPSFLAIYSSPRVRDFEGDVRTKGTTAQISANVCKPRLRYFFVSRLWIFRLGHSPLHLESIFVVIEVDRTLAFLRGLVNNMLGTLGTLNNRRCKVNPGPSSLKSPDDVIYPCQPGLDRAAESANFENRKLLAVPYLPCQRFLADSQQRGVLPYPRMSAPNPYSHPSFFPTHALVRKSSHSTHPTLH